MRDLDKSGFSLVEVLVSIGLISVISAGITGMLFTTLKTQRSISLTDELQGAVATARMNLSKTEVCTANLAEFSSLTFNGNQLGSVKFTFNRLINLTGSSVLLSNNQPLPGQPTTRLTMSVEKMTEIIPNKTYRGELVLRLDKDPNDSGTIVGPREISRSLPLTFDVTNSGPIQTIHSCSAFDSNALSAEDLEHLRAEICASMGGTYANGTCTLPKPDTANLKAEMCQAMNGTWNGSQCNLPQPAPVQIPVPNPVPMPVPVPAPSAPGVASVVRGGCGEVVVTYTNGQKHSFTVIGCTDW